MSDRNMHKIDKMEDSKIIYSSVHRLKLTSILIFRAYSFIKMREILRGLPLPSYASDTSMDSF